MKKFISLFLVFSILLLSGNLYAKRKGADLIVQEKDGTQVRGELIAVKQNSLLVSGYVSGPDISLTGPGGWDIWSVDIADISEITIVKKWKYGKGFLIGSAIGAGLGWTPALIPTVEEKFAAMLYGATVGALIAGGLGVIISWFSSFDKTIQFTGKSDTEIQEILEKLRKKARAPNFR